MLEFSDQPYRYFPPKRIAPIAWLLTRLNPLVRLPRTCRIKAVEISGEDGLRDLRAKGDRLLFLPNHSTHADPEIFTEAMRQAGITTQFMAAYDIFLRSAWHAWVMQKLGCFSVDREGSDPKAMAQAKATLLEGRHTLTIFPEGNVYLRNDEVTPFHEGAAMIGLRTARELRRRDVRSWIVPVSIKATHLADVREKLSELLQGLASAVEAKSSDHGSPLERIRSVGTAALQRNLRHRGIDVPKMEDLNEMIRAAAESVLSQLERKMDLEPRAKDSLIDRARRARRVVHQVRVDAEKAADHKAAELWANEAMVAFRIVSYRGDYVANRPTLDRYAETVEKLSEDIYSKMPEPCGPRCAFVEFGRPIDLGEYGESFKRKAREATRSLTDRVEEAVQDGIDRLNAANPHPGGALEVE